MLYFLPFNLFLLVKYQILTRSIAVEVMGTLLPQADFASLRCVPFSSFRIIIDFCTGPQQAVQALFVQNQMLQTVQPGYWDFGAGL